MRRAVVWLAAGALVSCGGGDGDSAEVRAAKASASHALKTDADLRQRVLTLGAGESA